MVGGISPLSKSTNRTSVVGGRKKHFDIGIDIDIAKGSRLRSSANFVIAYSLLL